MLFDEKCRCVVLNDCSVSLPEWTVDRDRQVNKFHNSPPHIKLVYSVSQTHEVHLVPWFDLTRENTEKLTVLTNLGIAIIPNTYY